MLEILEPLAGEGSKAFILRVLRYNITMLNLLPGAKLSEGDLCDFFRIGRTPLREALLELSETGLVDIYPKKGTFVSLIDTDMVEQIRQLQLLLNTQLVQEACKKATCNDVDLLRENIAMSDFYRHRGDSSKEIYLNQEFHNLLYRICGRECWAEIIRPVAPHMDRVIAFAVVENIADSIVQQHRALVEALEKRDVRTAREVVQEHMQLFLDNAILVYKRFPEYCCDKRLPDGIKQRQSQKSALHSRGKD